MIRWVCYIWSVGVDDCAVDWVDRPPTQKGFNHIPITSIPLPNPKTPQLNLRCPDFPKSLEWVNAPQLSLQKELRGKLVLLDFWTYCCMYVVYIFEECFIHL